MYTFPINTACLSSGFIVRAITKHFGGYITMSVGCFHSFFLKKMHQVCGLTLQLLLRGPLRIEGGNQNYGIVFPSKMPRV